MGMELVAGNYIFTLWFVHLHSWRTLFCYNWTEKPNKYQFLNIDERKNKLIKYFYTAVRKNSDAWDRSTKNLIAKNIFPKILFALATKSLSHTEILLLLLFYYQLIVIFKFYL